MLRRVIFEEARVLATIKVFNALFLAEYRTCLQGGADEPLYLPAKSGNGVNRVIFTHDYLASALHEAAHWCVAGEERRKKIDYGYWYAPDGRSESQQAVFEQVEVKPQAIEWILARSCGSEFTVSADNLYAGNTISKSFKNNIFMQARKYCIEGLPDRAERFAEALAEEFSCYAAKDPASYSMADI